MVQRKRTISLKDSCGLIGKSEDIFSPIKEALTNSFDAINQRHHCEDIFDANITLDISFQSKPSLDKTSDIFLHSISITDNGIGFTDQNTLNFQQFANRSKGLNNRGTGTTQIFCRFNKIKINSTFKKNGEYFNRQLSWNVTNDDYEETNPQKIENSDNKTVVVMLDPTLNSNEINFYARYFNDISSLKNDVLKYFLLRLWLCNNENNLVLNLNTYLDNNIKDSYTFDKVNIPVPDKEEEIIITAEKAIFSENPKNPEKNIIEWVPTDKKYSIFAHRFKLSNDSIDSNGVYLCSKDIVVEPFPFPAIRKNTDFNGYKYLTGIHGSLLDQPNSVNQTVDKFVFPYKKDIEKKIQTGDLFNREDEFILFDEINKQVGASLEKIYHDVSELKEEQEKNILELAQKYGISPEDAKASGISLNDTDDEAIKKMFKTQAKRFAKNSIEIYKTYDEIKSLKTKKLDPTSPEYKEKFAELSQKLLEKIPEQNKNELARYIIRRDLIVRLLELTLKNELDIQGSQNSSGTNQRKNNEAIIHDLICKRKSHETPNDLWILNEEFVHFSSYSDTELDKILINGEKLLKENIDIDKALEEVGIEKENYVKNRPDVFLFPEEGKCILIEFKAPEVDLADHTNQIQRYAKLIANYSRIPGQFKQFYGYLIGERVSEVKLDTSNWKKSYSGKNRIYPNCSIVKLDESEGVIANLYQELVLLSGIVEKAKLRNRSFAEKLGIVSDKISKD